jgi:hypothetical protein
MLEDKQFFFGRQLRCARFTHASKSPHQLAFSTIALSAAFLKASSVNAVSLYLSPQISAVFTFFKLQNSQISQMKILQVLPKMNQLFNQEIPEAITYK